MGTRPACSFPVVPLYSSLDSFLRTKPPHPALLPDDMAGGIMHAACGIECAATWRAREPKVPNPGAKYERPHGVGVRRVRAIAGGANTATALRKTGHSLDERPDTVELGSVRPETLRVTVAR